MREKILMKFKLGMCVPHLYELLVEGNYGEVVVADEESGELLPEVTATLDEFFGKDSMNTDYIEIEFDTESKTATVCNTGDYS